MDDKGDLRLAQRVPVLLAHCEVMATDVDGVVLRVVPKLVGTTCGIRSAPTVASRRAQHR